jgi:starch-binding outer membrane protein, SusD/RagB family
MTTTMKTGSRLGRAMMLPFALAATLGACDILDVDNPNNLLENDIQQVSAANAVVNGALSVVSIAIARTWQPISIIADELVFIGSRDAWQQLDWGFFSDPDNEFTNENFPFLGRGRWMADEAEAILEGHVQENPTSTALQRDMARAHIFSALMYTVLGETQQDFALSNKQEPGPAVGAANMYTMLDQAIAKLDKAYAIATALNDAELINRSLALRARAKHSRAIWDKIKPNIAANPLVSAPGAVADAQALLARVGDDWSWQLEFSSATIANEMAAWINSRGENQFDTLSIVNVLQTNVRQIQSVRIHDPIDDIPDPVITDKLVEWKGGPITGTGNIYSPLTLASARMMHLILAEDALQSGDVPGFQTHINHVREMDGLTPYAGQIPAEDMLVYSRRVNLFLMGLRLNDMYRFGIEDPHWRPNSDARDRPGTLLPITDIELRSNPNLR